MSEKILTIGYSALANRVKNITQPVVNLAHEVFISIQDPEKLDLAFPNNF